MTILNINEVKIKWYGHASFKLEHKGRKIFIDPYEIKTDEKADIILSTHGHYDHCSIKDIKKLTKQDTEIVITADSMSKIAHKIPTGNSRIAKPGDEFEIKKTTIKAVPAYNIDKQFHPKENQWVGYLIRINNLSFYHAGDTDFVPEMKKINTDVVMIPVGGTYTMDPKQAAEAVNIMQPKISIPMHYGKIVGKPDDAELFKKLCNTKVKIMTQ
ncbi:MBL fold metallo-hydrolase [Candidatus Woesearchaeota archaeon]|nr:MBL fold metallo-hydrolase [Candidatus Woesearchaeota archaeon]